MSTSEHEASVARSLSHTIVYIGSIFPLKHDREIGYRADQGILVAGQTSKQKPVPVNTAYTRIAH